MPKFHDSAQNVVEYGLLIVTIVIVVLMGVTQFGYLITPWLRVWPAALPAS